MKEKESQTEPLGGRRKRSREMQRVHAGRALGWAPASRAQLGNSSPCEQLVLESPHPGQRVNPGAASLLAEMQGPGRALPEPMPGQHGQPRPGMLLCS